MLDARAAA